MKFKTLATLFLLCSILFTACNDSDSDKLHEGGKYVLALGVTSSNNTSYYLVTTPDLMGQTISPIGNGIEQTGYRDFIQGGKTIFSIGGLGVTEASGYTMDASYRLHRKGNFVFDNTLAGLEQVDNSTMVGVEFPANPQSGNQIKFYRVNIDQVSITNTIATPVSNLTSIDWPSFTGMRIQADKVYVSYYLTDPNTFQTAHTDTAFVAVYSYPALDFITVMKDLRTGPVGTWNANNGLIKDEKGDIYAMSTSAIANGYSQSTKDAAFLRIKSGETAYDQTYLFDIQEATGGLKPAHIKYIGNGLVYAEVSTIQNQTAQWADVDLKVCIIDLYNKTVKDVTDIPVHDGNGGRSFPVFVEGDYVYHPVTLSNGVFMYRTDYKNRTAKKGAEVQTSFVGGAFNLE